MTDNRNSYSEDAINGLRGLCMGAADIVPGVSGGTVALILGHYERLVSAIANVDAQFFKWLLSGKFRDAFRHIDFRFLMALGIGIVAGILGLASLMHYLLVNHQAYIYSLFAGMILASSLLIARRMKQWTAMRVVLVLVGALIAWQICVLNPMQGNLSPLTAFFAATIAICAMILPGISGAFVLLLLGLYHPITELLRGLPKGDFSLDGLVIIAAFCFGCLVGLLSFSRLLRWLLNQRHDSTMAFLVGLMLGSLYKIWPFQQATPETADLPFKEQRLQWVMPECSANIPLVLLLVILGIAATLSLEVVGRKLQSK